MKGYGWIDFRGSGGTVIDAVRQLCEVRPELDLIFCNLHDWIANDMKGDRCKFLKADGRAAYVEPDAYVQRGTVHGIIQPENTAAEVGATWS